MGKAISINKKQIELNWDTEQVKNRGEIRDNEQKKIKKIKILEENKFEEPNN